MNVFDFALKMEADGKAYYEKLATETGIPEFKNIFSLLAAAEQNHHDALQAMKEGIDPAKAEAKVLDHARNVFMKLLRMDYTHDRLLFDRDGYLQAMKAEEESIKFYRTRKPGGQP